MRAVAGRNLRARLETAILLASIDEWDLHTEVGAALRHHRAAVVLACVGIAVPVLVLRARVRRVGVITRDAEVGVAPSPQ